MYGRIQGRNNDLTKPIDFNLLDTDFDFETNLELFKKEVEGVSRPCFCVLRLFGSYRKSEGRCVSRGGDRHDERMRCVEFVLFSEQLEC